MNWKYGYYSESEKPRISEQQLEEYKKEYDSVVNEWKKVTKELKYEEELKQQEVLKQQENYRM